MFKSASAFGLLAAFATATPVRADITVVMKGWDYIPRVEISRGKNTSCDLNRIVWSGQMKRNDRLPTFRGAGTQGDDICWRRSRDPLITNSDLGLWTRCSSNGECVVE